MFDEEDGVDVAPLNWLSDDEKSCRWPKDDIRGKALEKMVKDCAQLNKNNSSLYKCRVLCKAGNLLHTHLMEGYMSVVHINTSMQQ